MLSQDSALDVFASAQNVFITSSNFVSILVAAVNYLAIIVRRLQPRTMLSIISFSILAKHE